MENPIKVDDLGIPLFLETPILIFGGVDLWVLLQIFRVYFMTATVGKTNMRSDMLLHLPHVVPFSASLPVL